MIDDARNLKQEIASKDAKEGQDGRAPAGIFDIKSQEKWEKESKRAGKLMFSETIQEYRDQNGELVVTSRSIGVKTERPVEQS